MQQLNDLASIAQLELLELHACSLALQYDDLKPNDNISFFLA